MPGTVRLTTLGSKRGINILAADHVKAQKIRRAAGGASDGGIRRIRGSVDPASHFPGEYDRKIAPAGTRERTVARGCLVAAVRAGCEARPREYSRRLGPCAPGRALPPTQLRPPPPRC